MLQIQTLMKAHAESSKRWVLSEPAFEFEAPERSPYTLLAVPWGSRAHLAEFTIEGDRLTLVSLLYIV